MAAGALVPAAGVALAWLAGLRGGGAAGGGAGGGAIPGAAVDLPAAAAPALPAGRPPPWSPWRSRRPGAAGGRLRRPPRRRRRSPRRPLGGAGWALLRRPARRRGPRRRRSRRSTSARATRSCCAARRARRRCSTPGPPGVAGARWRAALRRLGVRRLDALVLTHDSLDHVGGGARRAGASGRRAVVPRAAAGGRLRARAPARPRAARDRGVPVRGLRAGGRLAVGPLEGDGALAGPRPARRAGPQPGEPGGAGLGRRPRRPVDRRRRERRPAPLALAGVDVLKVPHHGSEDPGLARVLDRLRPAVALISAGEGNPFRHPRPETLAALADGGVAAWRTDRLGRRHRHGLGRGRRRRRQPVTSPAHERPGAPEARLRDLGRGQGDGRAGAVAPGRPGRHAREACRPSGCAPRRPRPRTSWPPARPCRSPGCGS